VLVPLPLRAAGRRPARRSRPLRQRVHDARRDCTPLYAGATCTPSLRGTATCRNRQRWGFASTSSLMGSRRLLTIR
jgi:hypothetical protein